VGRGSNAYANHTNSTKRREDEHHDSQLNTMGGVLKNSDQRVTIEITFGKKENNA